MNDLSEKSKSVEGTETCASGCSCNCGRSSGSKKLKMAACLIVLLAIVGIFIYKASSIKQKDSSSSAQEANFTVTKSIPSSMPVNNSDASAIKTEKKVKNIAVAETLVNNATASESIQISRKIGESLDSLSSLNKVALSQDTVFVFIPAVKNEFADDMTKNAVIAAQRDLKLKNINIGLYTLPVSSPDYTALSAQVQAPAILVATKGKGMAVVSGEVTETKLLQAYMSSIRSSGCGPSSSGCGPSGCN